jgi:2-phospho-L-lactate guanylyltransferase
MTQVVIAARGGPDAKTRCAALLSAAQRSQLAELMLEDMLDAVLRADGVSGVSVVTPTLVIAALAKSRGVQVIPQDEPNGLNAAFELALGVLAETAPYAPTVLLMGDLPLMTPNELEAALALSETHGLIIAPAVADGGTSALILRAGARLPLAFGPDSFRRHLASARRLGLSAAVIECDGLGRDIDRPDDLAALVASPTRGRAARFLREHLGGRIIS